MKTYFQTENLADCCGCSACVSVCPKNSIEFKINSEGFRYPKKTLENCVDCGLCEKVCPFSDTYTCGNIQLPQAYAAYDSYNRAGSSSGGLFYTFAKYHFAYAPPPRAYCYNGTPRGDIFPPNFSNTPRPCPP